MLPQTPGSSPGRRRRRGPPAGYRSAPGRRPDAPHRRAAPARPARGRSSPRDEAPRSPRRPPVRRAAGPRGWAGRGPGSARRGAASPGGEGRGCGNCPRRAAASAGMAVEMVRMRQDRCTRDGWAAAAPGLSGRGSLPAMDADAIPKRNDQFARNQRQRRIVLSHRIDPREYPVAILPRPRTPFNECGPRTSTAAAGTLLCLVGLHSPQDIVEHVNGIQDMRPLVEHHAFSPPAHRGVGDLGTRRLTRLPPGSPLLCVSQMTGTWAAS